MKLRRTFVGTLPFVVTTVFLLVIATGALTLAGCSSTDQRASIDGLTAKFIDVEGVETRYYEYGEGEPMVLVHGGSIGGASTANNWSRTIPGLATRFHVVAVDRLAMGMTGNPNDDADFTNEGTVEHLYQFIQTMKLGRVHLVGHSAGGGLLLYLALAHPEVARTLTIIAHHAGIPPGDGPTTFDEILARCPPDRTTYEHRKCRLLALGHTPDTFPPAYADADEYMGNLPKSVEARKRMDAMRAAHPGWPDEQNEAYRTRMHERARNGDLQIPVLMFAALQDTLSWDADEPYAMMRSELALFDILGAKNARVKLIVMNDAGHFMYREHPEQFNASLTHFIEFWESRR